MFKLVDVYRLHRKTVDLELTVMVMDATFGPMDDFSDLDTTHFNKYGGESEAEFVGLV